MNLDDEIICGHLVTAKQKHINAVFLDMMREFARLCEAANITWFLVFGGLIGAVRHKGFIPWDDDIDVAVHRKDFDRLMAMTNEQFGAEYPWFLQNPVTDPGNGETLIRFRKSDTTCIRPEDYKDLMRTEQGVPYNMGLGLAIFPVDNLPRRRWAENLQYQISRVLSSFMYRAYAPPKEKPFRYFLAHSFLKLLGPRRFISFRHSIYRCCRKNRSGKVQIFAHFYGSACTVFDADIFDHAVMLPFEDMEVPVPVGYIRFLEIDYGDFMTFPPPEERVGIHHAYESYDTPYTISAEKLRTGEISLP